MARNSGIWALKQILLTSLSARRAWIEIAAGPAVGGSARVALRKESVDRNWLNCAPVWASATSLSARRAWIEIVYSRNAKASPCIVALRKESVDRNQGAAADRAAQQTSLSARRAWIEMQGRCLAR